MYNILLLAACCGLSVAMMIHDPHTNSDPNQEALQEELRQEQERQLAEADETVELDMSKPEERQRYLNWMKQIVEDNKHKHQLEESRHAQMSESGLSKSAALLRQVLAGKVSHEAPAKHHNQEKSFEQHKRFTDFTTPYLQYKLDKRNNGIWIWMPAQGYVSVPRQEEASENDISKPGKIMRYGRK